MPQFKGTPGHYGRCKMATRPPSQWLLLSLAMAGRGKSGERLSNFGGTGGIHVCPQHSSSPWTRNGQKYPTPPLRKPQPFYFWFLDYIWPLPSPKNGISVDLASIIIRGGSSEDMGTSLPSCPRTMVTPGHCRRCKKDSQANIKAQHHRCRCVCVCVFPSPQNRLVHSLLNIQGHTRVLITNAPIVDIALLVLLCLPTQLFAQQLIRESSP